MTQRIVLLLAATLACSDRHLSIPAGAQPRVHDPAELGRLIQSQAYEGRLAIDGLAFADSTLYVATNIGLIEIRHDSVQAVDQWLATDNVISGPWMDLPNKQLWVLRVHDYTFLTLRDGSWHLVPPPVPEDGYTRGDVLNGFSLAGDSTSFRLVGAGSVWQWSGTSWAEEPRPPNLGTDAIVGAAYLEGRPMVVTSSGGCAYLRCTNRSHWLLNGSWTHGQDLPVQDVDQVVAGPTAVYVRGTDGTLLRVDADAVRRVQTPGPCSSLTIGPHGHLLASFRGAGVYTADGEEWRQLFDDPAGDSTGQSRTYLAASANAIALATTTVPRLVSGKLDKFYEAGMLGLWLFHDGHVHRVVIGH